MNCAWPTRLALVRRQTFAAAPAHLPPSLPAAAKPADTGRLRPIALTLKPAEPAPLATWTCARVSQPAVRARTKTAIPIAASR